MTFLLIRFSFDLDTLVAVAKERERLGVESDYLMEEGDQQ
jgi:hypothetical protein